MDITPEAAEIFAREYVTTGSGQIAARRSGLIDTRYSLGVWADRLLTIPDIQLAVADALDAGVRPAQQKPTVYSREMLVEELGDIKEKAVGASAFTAAVGAVKTQAQLLGMLDTNVNIRVTDARELSLDQLRAMVAQLPAAAQVIEGDYTLTDRSLDA